MSHGRGDQSIFLRSSRDIEHVKEHGRRISTVLFNMLVCRIDGRGSRVGIVVGKRFGIAVRRNRAKRLFRELTRQVQTELVSGHDVVVFPKRDALGVSFEELKATWVNTFRRQGLIRS
ncbi:ribonuclease P protein component [Petrachloros mirabilis]|jgi:ribonuclease P protein component